MNIIKPEPIEDKQAEYLREFDRKLKLISKDKQDRIKYVEDGNTVIDAEL